MVFMITKVHCTLNKLMTRSSGKFPNLLSLCLAVRYSRPSHLPPSSTTRLSTECFDGMQSYVCPWQQHYSLQTFMIIYILMTVWHTGEPSLQAILSYVQPLLIKGINLFRYKLKSSKIAFCRQALHQCLLNRINSASPLSDTVTY